MENIKETLLELWENQSDAILLLARNIVAAVLIIVIGFFLTKGMKKIIKKTTFSKLDGGGAISALLRAFVRYGIFIVCVIMVLNIFGVNTTSLLALLGAAGVTIGLALKDTLGNIAAGMTLHFLNSARKGELIEFGEYLGTVTEMTLFTTIMETPDGILISAPNSHILGRPLKNYTRNGKRRLELSVGIAYSDSVDKAFAVMNGIIASEPRFLQDPAPMVILQSIEAHSVKITIRAWTQVEDYWNTYWDLTKITKERIEAAGLKIPLPQREVSIV